MAESQFRAGSAAIVYQSGGNVTLALSSGLQTGDIIFVCIWSGNSANTVTPPSSDGWTSITSVTGTDLDAEWFWKRCESDDPGTNKAFGVSASANTFGYYVAFYDAQASGTPYEDATSSGPTSSTTPATSAVTPTIADAIAICLGCVEDDTNWNTSPPPGGWTTRIDDGDNSGTDGRGVCISRGSLTKDSELASVNVGTITGAEYWATLTLILKPGIIALTATGVATGTPSVPSATLGQTHILTATGVATGTPAISNPTITSGATDLEAVSVATGNPTIGAPTIYQTHVFACGGIETGPPALTSPTLGQVHVLSATGVVTGSPELTQPSIGQEHVLSANGVATGIPSLGAPTIGQIHVLSANGITTGAPELTQPTLGQIHILSATGVSAGTPESSLPTIGQVHILTATGVVTGTPSLGSPTIGVGGASHDLEAEDVETGVPSLGTPSMTVDYNLTATSVETGTPSIGVPTLAETHVLTADDLETGTPTLGSPTLAQVHALTADGIDTGVPSIGQPLMGQIHVLTATGVVTGTPSIGSPTIAQIHILSADDIETGVPELGEPSAALIHDLTATGVTTGAPTLGTPDLCVHNLVANSVETGVPDIGIPVMVRIVNLVAEGVETKPPICGRPVLGIEAGEIAWLVWIQTVPELKNGVVTGIPREVRSLQFKHNSNLPEEPAYHDAIDNGQYSMELYLQLELTGITEGDSVQDIYFFLLSPSAKFLSDTGITISYRLSATFADPVNTAMVGGNPVPVTRATAVQWTTPYASETLYSPGQRTDYLVLQVAYPGNTRTPPPIRLGVYYSVVA